MMKSNLAKKQLTMVTLVLALALAVYINWRFANNDNNALQLTDVVADDQQQPVSANEETGDDGGKYYVEALFVSADEDNSGTYFTEARLNRTQSRDQALDTLQKSLQQTDLTQSEKDALTASLAAVANNITIEGNIESLVKAKGFEDCVAFINDAKVKIVVKANEGGLSVSEVSQIKEIVLGEYTVDVQNVTIVEIK
jgi:stage III sporulation protein AH